MNALDCRVFYDSSRTPGFAAGGPTAIAAIDLAAGPAGSDSDHGAAAEAELLARLGVAVPDDLPAAVLTSVDGRVRLLGVRLTAGEVEALAAGRGWPPASVVVYSADWCGDCRRTKRQLGEAGVSFSEVDIERDARAEALVLQHSGGRRVVPTLELDGRLWAFNPDPSLLRRLIAPDPR